MSCGGVSCRLSSDPTLLGLWCRSTAAAPIRPLAWELPYAACAALKRKKKKNQNQKTQRHPGSDFPVSDRCSQRQHLCFFHLTRYTSPGQDLCLPYQTWGTFGPRARYALSAWSSLRARKKLGTSLPIGQTAGRFVVKSKAQERGNQPKGILILALPLTFIVTLGSLFPSPSPILGFFI